ncbi:PDZ domain-containing protein [bacterium]|nr:PDZ domain-containing protein [bacterium]
MSNSFGMDVERNRWGVIVKEVFENYPAIEAGISDGDYIIDLNNIDVTKMNFNDFCYLLKKSSSKPVSLKIRRGEDILVFDLKPIDAWKFYINNFSDILVNQIGDKPLPQFYTSRYRVRIKGKEAETSLLDFVCNENEKFLYNDIFIKEITESAVKRAGNLPDNYDEALLEVEFSRDGINNEINTKLISKYKKASVKLFNNTDKFANFTDIINTFKKRKDVKNIEMTVVYKEPIPVGEVYNGRVLSYTNLKTTNTNQLVRMLDKITKEVTYEVKKMKNADGITIKLACYPEINLKIYPVKFNNVQFEVFYNLKSSKGYCYMHPEKLVVTPNQINYPYYISEIELKPVACNKNMTAEVFSKSLYSYYKKSYPDVVLEKIKAENALSRQDGYAIRGKDVIVEIVPDKQNKSFIVKYFNLLNIKEFNKEYKIFLKYLEKTN